MKNLVFSLCLLGTLGVHGAAAASPVPDYQCQIEDHPDLARVGYRLGELIYSFGDSVGLTGYPYDDSEVLIRVPAASGEKYSNDLITFHAKGDEGSLSLSDGRRFPCWRYAPAPEAASSAYTLANTCLYDLGVTEDFIGKETDSLDDILALLDALMPEEEMREDLQFVKSETRACVAKLEAVWKEW